MVYNQEQMFLSGGVEVITYVRGDLFTSPAPVLVNTVNTVGVMGKGIAKDFKYYFPEMFEAYQESCERGELQIGKLHFWRGMPKSVLNFPTKRHWRQRSRIADIEAGLHTFITNYDRMSITSIAFPQLGSGNGGLDWQSEVRPLMERYLGCLPIDVYIHLYSSELQFVEHRDSAAMKTWLRTEPESLPFSEVWDDIRSLALNWTGHTSDGTWSGATSDEELRLVCDGEDARLSTYELRNIWDQLRLFGFVSLEELSPGREHAQRAISAFLTQLGYVHPVRFARTPMGLSNLIDLVDGIQLVLRSSKSTLEGTGQLGLLA